jgi:carbon-monoxide dehydrogenase medium subunit
MALWQEYLTPTTLAEALEALAHYGAAAKVVAGGTDLILEMQQGHTPVEPGQPYAALVDVTHIAGLDAIQVDGVHLVIGAAATHAQVEASDLLRAHAAALVESCSVVGGPQVRNVATLGGNVAHALPAADGTIGLLAMEAEAEIATWAPEQAGRVQRAWLPLTALFAGPGRNTLESGQLITAFRIAKRAPRSGSAFDRIMRPQGVALPILGLAAQVQVEETGRRALRATIAVGPAGPVPFLAHGAEAALCAARDLSGGLEEALAGVLVAAHAEVAFRTSKHRASRAYRDEMLDVLLRRVLTRAIGRARSA